MAFASPPADPGGGVICVNSVGDSDGEPLVEEDAQDPQQEEHAEAHRPQRHHEVEAVEEEPAAVEIVHA